MTVVKINALTVPGDDDADLARRFASRSGAVDQQDGFEGFELLRPTDGRSTWLVITRWRDEEAFEAWTHSADFARAHRHPGDEEPPPHPPAKIDSEIWSFTPAG
jgi:heme-degrading monooxygenase HmoA